MWLVLLEHDRVGVARVAARSLLPRFVGLVGAPHAGGILGACGQRAHGVLHDVLTDGDERRGNVQAGVDELCCRLADSFRTGLERENRVRDAQLPWPCYLPSRPVDEEREKLLVTREAHYADDRLQVLMVHVLEVHWTKDTIGVGLKQDLIEAELADAVGEMKVVESAWAEADEWVPRHV